MPIINSFNDITKYEGDAIVNSIGVEGKLYGRLCKTILKEANDKELEIFINSQYNQIGTVLVTKAGKLPCKNIIHVVTPFKKDDDGNNSNLIKAYESIISKALEIGIKSIAIPFIGTGANGYDENDAYESIMAACSQILIQEEKEDRDILDITVVAYLKKQQSYQKVREEQETRMIYDSTVNNKTKENEFSRVIIKYGNEMATMKKEDMLVPGRPSYQFPYDYVEDYITQKNFNEKKLANEGLDRRRKYQLRNTKALKKLDIYRLAFIMGMNKTEVIQFMILAGHSFSPLDPLDVFFLNYLNGKYGKITSLFELSNLASEKCNKIFMYCEE